MERVEENVYPGVKPSRSRRAVKRASASPAPLLTDRQLQALRLVGKGLSTREIALEMDCSARTAKYFVDNLRQKFGVARKRHLVSIAREMEA